MSNPLTGKYPKNSAKPAKKVVSEKEEFSKFLALVLRHNPGLIGLSLDNGGWADIDELLDKMSISLMSQGKKSVDRAFLETVVKEDDKQRYIISDSGWRIRANQGHSVPVDLQLKKATPPKYLYHGTVQKNVWPISVNGLLKMKRNHVHLSNDLDTAKKVGARHGYPKILRIKAEEMAASGYEFSLSENNVWLTDMVPPKFIEFDWEDKGE